MTKLIGRDFWDISPLFERRRKPPVPKEKLRCPVCNSEVIYFKQSRAFKRSHTQYRVDITVKCGKCAHVFVFGVHITKEEFERMSNKLLEYAHTGHINLNEVR
jgi:uncharacterized protein with PIN domain